MTLMQTNKVHGFPVILFGSSDWSSLLEWIEGTAGGVVRLPREGFFPGPRPRKGPGTDATNEVRRIWT